MNVEQRATAERLAKTSTNGLLTTFAALTHQIDAAQRADRKQREHDLREERDQVKHEILTRTGDIK